MDGAAARFAGVGVATAVNPMTVILGNAAHLGEISASQEVEKIAETLGEVTRRAGESARSSRSSRQQWRWCLRRRSRERERQSE